MMRSMFSGVSGLAVHQTRMDVIANNISNVNTVGFKSSRVLFSDVFSQTVQGATGANLEGTGRGGVNAMQIGLGAQVASIDRMMTQGAAQRTDHAFDLMLEGSGFFVVGDASGTYFTRNGAIRPDAFGNLTISNGMQLMGWQVNGPHSHPDDPSVWGEVVRGQVEGLSLTPGMQSIPPIPTTGTEFGGNIVPEGRWDGVGTGERVAGPYTTPAAMPTFNGTTGLWEIPIQEYTPGAAGAAGTWGPTTPPRMATWNSPEVNTTMQIHDSLGRRHTIDVVMEMTPAGADGTTVWTMRMPDVIQAEQPAAAPFPAIPAGPVEFTLVFGPNGQLRATAPGNQAGPLAAAATAAQNTLIDSWGGRDAARSVNLQLNSPIVPAAEFENISLNFAGLTQFGSVRQNPTITDLNGRAAGELTDLSIGQDGTVMGLYSNGMQAALFQIPIAEFTNPAGLESFGGSLFRQTINSGSFDGIGQDGIMRGGVLEMSNVDISSEFTDMIITQRGFQANSRTISTSSDMLQELVNLGR